MSDSDKDHERVVLVLTRRECAALVKRAPVRIAEQIKREMGAQDPADKARSILERAYYSDVKRHAGYFRERIEKGAWSDEDAFWEAFHEETNGALVYCCEQWDAVYSSRKSGEAWEELRDMGHEMGESEYDTLGPWAVLCLRLDLREELGDVSSMFEALSGVSSDDDSEEE